MQGRLALNPFQDAPALWAAASSAEKQRALLLDRQVILLLDVAQTYYQVLRSEKQALVLKHSVRVQQQRVDDLEVQRRAGVARPVDVSQSEAQLAGTRNALIRARNDVRNGRAMLAQLMGVPAVEGALVAGFEVPRVYRPVDQLLPLADAHRQDLQAARMQVIAAAERLEAAWGGYFPSVSLNLTGYLYRESFPDDVDWTGLIQVDLPIFSAGLVHANVRTGSPACVRLTRPNPDCVAWSSGNCAWLWKTSRPICNRSTNCAFAGRPPGGFASGRCGLLGGTRHQLGASRGPGSSSVR